jgi:hypothetical protein
MCPPEGLSVDDKAVIPARFELAVSWLRTTLPISLFSRSPTRSAKPATATSLAEQGSNQRRPVIRSGGRTRTCIY